MLELNNFQTCDHAMCSSNLIPALNPGKSAKPKIRHPTHEMHLMHFVKPFEKYEFPYSMTFNKTKYFNIRRHHVNCQILKVKASILESRFAALYRIFSSLVEVEDEVESIL